MMKFLRLLNRLGCGAALLGAGGVWAELPPPEETQVWEPVPPVVSVGADGVPSDAIVLFDGSNLDAWKPERAGSPGWKVEDGVMWVVPGTGPMRTREAFGSMQLHLEIRTPPSDGSKGQKRGNSGAFLMGLYELQILDSYENPTYVNGQAGAVYKQHIPQVNASRPPGQWQSYDVVFTAPRFGAGGGLERPAYVTLLHNGVLVQDHVELKGPTVNRGHPAYRPHAAELPLSLQDHKGLVSFRNIWVRRLEP